jgi:probable HAF family extracellular repeat protein
MLPYKVIDVSNYMQYPNGRGVNIHDHIVGWNNPHAGINQGFIQLGIGGGMEFVAAPAGSPSKSGTFVMSINNNGVAVWNWEEIETKICHAVIWEKGQLTDLAPLIGASSCAAMDINDRGQIVGIADFAPIPSGTAVDLGMKGHAFLYETNGGGVTDLGVLAGHSMSRAEAVNELGQVVGISAHWDAPSYTQYSIRPFLYKDGSLNELTGEEGTAVDINDLGHVLGARQLSLQNPPFTKNKPFIWRDGKVESIPLDDADPKAINNSDQVVGEVWTQYPHYGFLYQKGQVTNLNTLVAGQLPAGAYIGYAWDINDKGHILVGGVGPSPAFAGFMALLVPDLVTWRVKVEGLRELVVQILFGVTQDGGGWVLIGKTIRRIPPMGPLSIDHWEMVFDYCSALLRDVVEDQYDLEEARRELRRIIDESIAGRE